MRRDVVVIGASAGGVEALQTLVSVLPADLPATVLVVLHLPRYGGSVLPAILSRSGPLPARHPEPGETLPAGTILVAPPDHHLLLDGGRVALTRGPRENGHRPAIDTLFRSAARAADGRVIGVVLSGVLDDGTAGLVAVAARSGLTVVQEPTDALYDGMPRSALAAVPVDYVLPAAEVGRRLESWCREEIADPATELPDLMDVEARIALMEAEVLNEPERPGTPSGFSCPDCNGVLWEIEESGVLRYRCRVGHAWSAQSLFTEQQEQLEGALWMAMRGLEEKAALARQLGERAAERGNQHTARRFADQETEASRAASLIRAMLEAHAGGHEAAGN